MKTKTSEKLFEEHFRIVEKVSSEMKYLAIGDPYGNVYKFTAFKEWRECLNEMYGDLYFSFCPEDGTKTLTIGKTYYLFDDEDGQAEIVDIEYLELWFAEQIAKLKKA